MSRGDVLTLVGLIFTILAFLFNSGWAIKLGKYLIRKASPPPSPNLELNALLAPALDRYSIALNNHAASINKLSVALEGFKEAGCAERRVAVDAVQKAIDDLGSGIKIGSDAIEAIADGVGAMRTRLTQLRNRGGA